jgi:hypothetical protein
VLRGDPETAELVRAELSDLLGRRGLALRVTVLEATDVSTPVRQTLPDAAVNVTLALREDGARVLVADPAEGSAVSSRDITSTGSRAVLAAEVAEVVLAATDSLCDVAPGKPRTPALPDPATRIEPPPQSLAQPLHPGPFVGVPGAVDALVQPFADQPDATFGLGGAIGISLARVTARPSISLTGHYFFSARATQNSVTADISRGAVRLQLAANVLRVAWLELAIGAAAGADIVLVHPNSVSTTVSPRGDATVASPIMGAVVTARARVAQGTYLELGALLDGDLAPVRYVLKVPSPGPNKPVSTPYSVRPGVAFGVAFDLVGPLNLEGH